MLSREAGPTQTNHYYGFVVSLPASTKFGHVFSYLLYYGSSEQASPAQTRTDKTVTSETVTFDRLVTLGDRHHYYQIFVKRLQFQCISDWP